MELIECILGLQKLINIPEVKYIFIQPRVNLNHIIFNASVLNNFKIEDKIVYWSYEENIKQISDKIKNKNIKLEILSKEKKENIFSDFISSFTYLDTFTRILRKRLINEKDDCTIIILQTTPKIIHCLRSLEIDDKKIIYFFHRAFNDRSSIDYFKKFYLFKDLQGSFLKRVKTFFKKSSKHFFEKYYFRYFDFFKIIRDNERVVVFSGIKKQKILEFYPHLKKMIRVVGFNYTFKDYDFDYILNKRLEEKAFSIVKLGVINENKGIDFLKKISLEVSEKIDLYGVGPTTPENYLNSRVRIFCEGIGKRQIEFENEIMLKKYSVILHKKEFIEEIVSGTFYDSVNYGLPILCIRNVFFESFFDKYGDIGIMFNNINDMIAFLNNIKFDENIYLRRVSNVLKLKNKLKEEMNKADLYKEILGC